MRRTFLAALLLALAIVQPLLASAATAIDFEIRAGGYPVGGNHQVVLANGTKINIAIINERASDSYIAFNITNTGTHNSSEILLEHQRASLLGRPNKDNRLQRD
jgi:hypothetical protein